MFRHRLHVLALAVGCLLAQPGLSGVADASGPALRSQLTARKQAVLSSEIAAKIDRVLLREGATFAEGDLLLAFDDDLQQAQVRRARAVLTAAERTYAANQRLFRLNSIG